MKKEFPIIDEWLPYEIHPETPREGVLLKDCFPGMDTAAFFERLNGRGKEMGIKFGPQTRLSNSRMAMEAGEFARDHDKYDSFHEAMFKAFFTDCKDIGNRNVILDVAHESGLDTNKLITAIESGIYRSRLEETTRKARENFINAAPTFIIEGYGTLTGAQPMETFRTIMMAFV